MISKLSKALWVLGITLLVACGGDNGGKASAAAGLYKGSGEKMTKAKAVYFFITANGDLYLLKQNQTEINRSYQANVSDMSYTFDGTNFSSGDLTGSKLSGTEAEIPANVKTVVSVNASAAKLIQVLNDNGISLQVRLEQTVPSFSDQQAVVLDAFAQSSADLIKYMKDNKLTSFWINDYTNTNLYTKSSRLHLPAGIGSLSGADANNNLKSSTNIDAY